MVWSTDHIAVDVDKKIKKENEASDDRHNKKRIFDEKLTLNERTSAT